MLDYYSSFDDKTIKSITRFIKRTQDVDTIGFSEKDFIKYGQDISYLYPIHIFYRFMSSTLLMSKFESLGFPLTVLDPVIKIYKEGKTFNIFEHHYINLDTGFFINKFFKDNNIKKVLNCGTGAGSTVAYSVMGLKDLCISTIEHMHEFSKISKLFIDYLRDLGLPLNKNINYINSNLYEIKNDNNVRKYEKFLFSNKFKKAYRKEQHPYVAYEMDFNEKFDVVILDGPSFFRFPTLLRALDFLDKDGFVIFEYCRKEISILKRLGVKIFAEEGRVQKKRIRITKTEKDVVKSITIIKASEIKKILGK